MFSHSSSVVSNSFTYAKCLLVSPLMENITALEVRIQFLERVSESESSIVSVGKN